MLTYYECCYRDVEDLLANEKELQAIVENAPNVSNAALLLYNELRSEGWSDYVTGEASGSYKCNAYEAMRMVIDNLSDVAKAYMDLNLHKEFPCDTYYHRWEKMDVNARIANLWQATFDATLDYLAVKDK